MYIVAEIGTSHEGSLDKAKNLVEKAKYVGANCVKFQWVYADEILTKMEETLKEAYLEIHKNKEELKKN